MAVIIIIVATNDLKTLVLLSSRAMKGGSSTECGSRVHDIRLIELTPALEYCLGIVSNSATTISSFQRILEIRRWIFAFLVGIWESQDFWNCEK